MTWLISPFPVLSWSRPSTSSNKPPGTVHAAVLIGGDHRVLITQRCLILEVSFHGATMNDGYRAVDRALEHWPTTLVVFNDLVALGACARLQEVRLQVPGDLSVTGSDDIPFARYAKLAMTTVHNPTDELGRWAGNCSTLDRRIGSTDVLGLDRLTGSIDVLGGDLTGVGTARLA